MDILLHNLSHADLLLGVAVSPNSEVSIVRPKFSKFHTLSKSLFDHIVHHIDSVKIFSSPLHNRHGSIDDGIDLPSVPVGFDLRDCPARCSVHDVRFRHELICEDIGDSGRFPCLYLKLLSFNECLPNNSFVYIAYFMSRMPRTLRILPYLGGLTQALAVAHFFLPGALDSGLW